MAILADIESGIVSRLKTLWPSGVEQIAEFDISARVDSIVCPGVFVAAYTTGYKMVAKDLFHRNVAVQVFLVNKSLRGHQDRRRGTHPIVEACEQLLSGQQLGLDIDPLIPVRCPDVTDAELTSSRKVAFRLDLRTGCEVEKMDDSEAVDLLRIGATFLYKPGDDLPESSVQIEL